MKNVSILILACVIVVLMSGCSTLFNLTFDGEKWGIGISGAVPQIPLVDYSKEIDLD